LRTQAYDIAEQKQVTAWPDLRAGAARGEDEKFVDSQVALMIQGVWDF
jgi:hypothetical protein